MCRPTIKCWPRHNQIMGATSVKHCFIKDIFTMRNPVFWRLDIIQCSISLIEFSIILLKIFCCKENHNFMDENAGGTDYQEM